MNLKNKTILVTGGAGFIGSHLCETLLDKEVDKVYILDNLCQSHLGNILDIMKSPKIEFVRGDVRNKVLVEDLVLKSDVIFHLAASDIGHSEISPRIDMETNVAGTLNILEAARKKPSVRIVHASSGSVIGSSDKPADEDAILKPTTLYGISKMTGEKYAAFYAEEYDIKVSVIRYFHVFGPRQNYRGKAGVINIFLSRILKGLPPVIWGNGEQLKCFTYVQDSVDATIFLAENEKAIGEIYNVASEERMTINKLALILIGMYAEDKKMKPLYAQAKVGENMKPNPDTSKIERLGFRFNYNFVTGIDKTTKWVEENL